MKWLVILTLCLTYTEADPLRGGRIFNGRDAVVGEAPFMIQFRQIAVGGTFAQHFCGGESLNSYLSVLNVDGFVTLGALVNPRWIVSAAHCFSWNWQGRFTFIATAAQHNWRVENPDEQTSNVAQVVNHPSYNNQGGMVVSPFDINVVRVDSDFIYNSLVQPIALPPLNFIHTGDVQAYGWGSMVPVAPPILPDILQTATNYIIEYASCRQLLDAIFRSGHPFHFTDMCTGPLDGRHGVCNADSGGPIVQNNPTTGNLELVGVVAWGAQPCNSVNFPSVFARVSAFIDFINQNVS